MARPKKALVVAVSPEGEEYIDFGVPLSEKNLASHVFETILTELDSGSVKVVITKRDKDKFIDATLTMKWVDDTGKSYISVNNRCLPLSEVEKIITGHVNDFRQTMRQDKRGIVIGNQKHNIQVIGFNF